MVSPIVAKATRTQTRRSVTQDLKLVASYTTISSANLKEASLLLAKLQQFRVDLAALDEIVAESLVADDNALDSDIDRSCMYQSDINAAVRELEYALTTFQAEQAAIPSPTQANSASAQTVSMQPRGVRHKALDVDVVKFSGDPAHWEEFYDDFCATVDSKAHYSAVEKLKILKASLEGEAQGVPKGYLLTAANYEQAKQALQERYGNKQVRRFAHFEALLAIPPADHQTAKLVEMRDQCETHIRSLVALGMDEDKFGEVFILILLSKLPKFVRMEISRKNGTDEWTLPTLRQLLKNEIEIRETCDRTSWAEKEPKFRTKGPRKRSLEPKPAASALVAQSSRANGRPKQCAFCRKGHESQNCQVYADAISRRRQATKLCFACLETGHVFRFCNNKKSCNICGRRTHHPSLCFDKYPPRDGKPVSLQKDSVQIVSDQVSPDRDRSVGESVTVVASELRQGRAILETAVATVKGARSEVKARLIFDSAATLTFVTTKLARDVGATMVGEEVTSVGRFRDKRRSASVYRLYEMDIVLPNGSCKRIVANGVDVISTPVQMVPISASHRSVLASVALAEPLLENPKTVEVEILIGLDCYHAFFEDAQIRLTDELVLKKSVFGWIVSGFQRGTPAGSEDNVHVTLRVDGRKAEFFDVEKFWSLDEIGIRDDPGSVDDEAALKFFNQTITFKDGRYQVKWPFKELHPNLPTNRSVALRRLKSLWLKLKDQPQTLAAYGQIITDQLSKQIIEVAPIKPNGLVHYLPHHGVVKESSATTKLRVVYDASAKASRESLSLNECLFRGPVMMSDLCGILVRTRLHPVAILSDVEKAYLQIGLQLEDRDVTRFFWFKDASKGFHDDNLICYRFRRVLFGMRPSAFMLAGALAVHLRRSDKPVAKELEGNIYVDNAFIGKSTVESALQFYREAKQLLSEASMNLREWVSNSPEFMQSIPESDRGKGDVAQLLGIKWHLESDHLSSSPKFRVLQQPITKRTVLKAIATVYDPCGWFCPVLMAAKFLMQELWLRKEDWAAEIPLELRPTWNSVWRNLQGISEIRIPRCVDARTALPESIIELHTFCDASAKAYAAATFIRVKNGDHVSASLLFAEGRISPASKKLTIPRLELVETVIGVRLLNFVATELRLPVVRRVIWVDSTCVLHWLNSKCVQTTFVENRLREIRRSVGAVEFRYVPTSDNPADLPTRGMDADVLQGSTLWWNGPSWLLQSEDKWPENVEIPDRPLDPKSDENVVATVVVDGATESKLLNLSRYSTMSRLLRVTVWVMRFVDRLKGERPTDSRITAGELAKAEKFWVKQVQMETVPTLAGVEICRDFRREKLRLGLYPDPDGIIRCKGRLDHTESSESQQRPIYLPNRHPFAKLAVLRAHFRSFHGGVASTLADVRSAYWIPQGRVLTKKVINDCPRCRRVAGGPFAIPDPPSLPPERVQEADPFAVTGIDYAGPLYVIQSGETKKVWVALFTCAVVRAVHLEVAESLSAADFLLCLRRFVAVRGAPKIVISDNDKQFRLSSSLFANDWATAVTSGEVKDYCAESGIEWRFVPEMSPWMGGFYERMVKPVKDALKKVLGPNTVSLKELYTLLAEIALVINRRPLTYLETDVGDRPIRPVDFLRHSGTSLAAPSQDFALGRRPTARDLVEQWVEGQKCLARCVGTRSDLSTC